MLCNLNKTGPNNRLRELFCFHGNNHAQWFCFYLGAFLIPYLIMLVLAGIPLVCLEMSLGQRAGHQSPLKSWQSLGPRLKWIGLATVMNSLICSFYYCLIVTWCLYYFCFSLTSTLPWKSCPSATETGNKSTILTVDLECASASPAEYFWFRSTLDTSDDMNHINGMYC